MMASRSTTSVRAQNAIKRQIGVGAMVMIKSPLTFVVALRDTCSMPCLDQTVLNPPSAIMMQPVT